MSKVRQIPLFHYCALFSDTETGVLHYFDGTLATDWDLGDDAALAALRKAIADRSPQKPDPSTVTILSLTVIGSRAVEARKLQ
jgi:hypothetical protein